MGSIALTPDLVNVIASRAEMTVDLRNTDTVLLAEAERRLAEFLEQLAAGEQVSVNARRLARFDPVEFDARVVDLVEATARGLGHSVRRMPSGAGHDAQMLARVCPAGMIFVPSHDGISHNPAEHTDPADLEAGRQRAPPHPARAGRDGRAARAGRRRRGGPMTRVVTVGAAQLGPIARAETRAHVVDRMLVLLHEAHDRGCDLVVYPELALTTFFPRWFFDDDAELDEFFEREMPGPDTKPLFDEAARLGVGFCLGYAELSVDGSGRAHRYNTQVLVARRRDGRRPLPQGPPAGPRGARAARDRSSTSSAGTSSPGPTASACGARSAASSGWRSATTGAGPRPIACSACRAPSSCSSATTRRSTTRPTPARTGSPASTTGSSCRSGAYQNGDLGRRRREVRREEGVDLLGESMIVAPSGEIVAEATTVDDELVVAECDLDRCIAYRTTLFDFDRYRMPQHYTRITSQRGVELPPEPAPPEETP